MSCLSKRATVLPMIRLNVSPIPIGRKPGFLLSGISRLERKASSESSVSMVMHRRFVILASDEHRSFDSVLKLFEQRMRRQPSPSSPEGPAPPFVLNADCRIISPSISSNLTGCSLIGESLRRISGSAGSDGGCFCLRAFNVSVLRGRIPLLIFLLRSFIAPLMLPFAIFLTNSCDISWMDNCLTFDDCRCFCMVSPSCRSSRRSPFSHRTRRLDSASAWSLDFDFRDGFCRRRAGMTIIALREMVLMDDSSTQLLTSRLSSRINLLPLFPDGRRNRFCRQKTIFS